MSCRNKSDLTGWDESHTIIGEGGELATFQNLGKTQTILDATGEVIQVASWTNSGPKTEYLRPDLGFGRPSADDELGVVDGAALFGLALALNAWFASTAEPDQAPILAFRAREYRERLDGFPYRKIVVDVARGDLESGRQHCATLRAWLSQEMDSDFRWVITKIVEALCPLLAADDREGLARQLREWEAYTARNLKIESIWEPTPFPVELQSH